MHPWSPCGSMYDATFQSSLYPLMGRKVSVQTIRGSVTGRLTHIQSDHVVVQSGGAPFFIRMQQILWVVPVTKSKRQPMSSPLPY
jgi:hypothetical protein